MCAEEFNKVYNDLCTQDANAKASIDSWATYVGQMPALNWNPDTDASGGANKFAFFSAATHRWYVVGTVADVRMSIMAGQVWGGGNQISGVASGTEECYGGDADGSGNVCVSAGNTNGVIFHWTKATGTWAKVTLPGPINVLAGKESHVVYDPVHSLWCCAYKAQGAPDFLRVLTSPDRAVWTQRTTMTDNTTDDSRLAVNKTTGRIVLVTITGKLATSDDGGVTWTTRTTIGIGASAWTFFHLAHNPDANQFMLTVGEISGTPSGEVWTSTDGIAWTKVKTLTASAIGRAAPYGIGWVSLARDADGLNQIVYSLDGGATWELAGFSPSGNVRGVFAGGGGFLCVCETTVHPSTRADRPALGTIG